MVLVCDGHVCALGLSMVVRVIIVTVLMRLSYLFGRNIRLNALQDYLQALAAFKLSSDDGDIEELIRDTEQKPNEINSFYDTVSEFVDQLEQLWIANELARVLGSQLRPEIRHENLYIDVRTVSELREICKRRETFLDDVKRCSGYTKDSPFKREISEVCQEIEDKVGMSKLPVKPKTSNAARNQLTMTDH
ncbi:GM18286 [Drosophila sechellia]|uniref:GM18286 n=1 Tax=Drosophila sechellia TaxID=7238 RepID=B4I2A5_DROSE|nr:GM18286 [Drosophila sechellia]